MEVEKIGEFCGKHIGKTAMNVLRFRAKGFDVDARGTEHLRALGEKPYILVSNHVKPDVPIFKECGASPDSFILERLVAQETERQLKIVARCDKGRWTEGPYGRKFQERVENPFLKGFVGGMDLLPVKRIPGRVNSDFFKSVKKTFGEGNPLLIFPEGEYRDQFDEETLMKSGFAYIAKKFGVPVLPAYIHGCTSWQLNRNVSLIFGEAVASDGREMADMIKELKLKMLALKQDLQSPVLDRQLQNRREVYAVVND